MRRKPVLSIAYHRKSIELMAQMGLAEYAVDIGLVTLETLQDRFLALTAQAACVTEALGQRVPAVRAALDTQYTRAFGLLEAVS